MIRSNFRISLTCRSFFDCHQDFLLRTGLPPTLFTRLQYKLEHEVFDFPGVCQIEEDENNVRRCLCTLEEGLNDHQDVYVIDHAFSFPDEEVRATIPECFTSSQQNR